MAVLSSKSRDFLAPGGPRMGAKPGLSEIVSSVAQFMGRPSLCSAGGSTPSIPDRSGACRTPWRRTGAPLHVRGLSPTLPNAHSSYESEAFELHEDAVRG